MNGNNTDFYSPTEEEMREIEWQITYEYYVEQQWMDEHGIEWDGHIMWKSPCSNSTQEENTDYSD